MLGWIDLIISEDKKKKIVMLPRFVFIVWSAITESEGINMARSSSSPSLLVIPSFTTTTPNPPPSVCTRYQIRNPFVSTGQQFNFSSFPPFCEFFRATGNCHLHLVMAKRSDKTGICVLIFPLYLQASDCDSFEMQIDSVTYSSVYNGYVRVLQRESALNRRHHS